MPNPLVGMIGASVGSSVIGASAAGDAADAQAQSAREQIELQREIYADTTGRFQPFYDSGTTGWQAYLSEMGLADAPTIGGTAPEIQTITDPGQSYSGLGPVFERIFGQKMVDELGPEFSQVLGASSTAPTTRYSVGGQTFGTMEEAQAYANTHKTGGETFGGFQKTPGYDFQLGQGMDALQSTAAAKGNLLSGATMKDAITFGEGLANQEYGNYLNRLAGIAASGQAAAGNQANIGANYAANAGNALASMGNAQAAGAIGQANAWNGGLNNLTGVLGYMDGFGKTGSGNWLFGGNSWG